MTGKDKPYSFSDFHFSDVGSLRSICGPTVKAATVVAPKYTTLQPLGDKVLIKCKAIKKQIPGDHIWPSKIKLKPQRGWVVAIGEGSTVGPNKVSVSVETGTHVVYHKFGGTEVEFNGTNYRIMKEDDIIGILDTDDVKDLKLLNDRVLIKVAEEITSSSPLLPLFRTAGKKAINGTASEDKSIIGTVIAVGPGKLDEEGKKKPLSVSTGNTVMYSKYAGIYFKSSDGSEYIAIRESDVMAVLSECPILAELNKAW